MRTRLGNRIHATKGRLIYRFFSDSGYIFLSFVALFLSAVFYDFMWQFMTLALILGLKWIFGNRTQIIQIFSNVSPNDVYADRKGEILQRRK